jgi:hypothetical protein
LFLSRWQFKIVYRLSSIVYRLSSIVGVVLVLVCEVWVFHGLFVRGIILSFCASVW